MNDVVFVYSGRVASLVLLISLMLPVICTAAYPCADDSSAVADSARTVGDDLAESARSLGSLLSAPLRWDANDLLIAGGFVTGVAGAYALDYDTRDLFQHNHSSLNDALKPVANGYATVLYMGPSALAFYLTGAAIDNDWIRDTGQMLVEGVIATGIIQLPLSTVVGRARPFLNEGHASFRAFAGGNDDRASFFSGHSMIAFSFSTILSRQIDNLWATIGLYTLAASGPMARMYIDKHWLSDCFFGSAMGYIVGDAIHRWHSMRNGNDKAGLLILPSPGGLSVVGWF
jgi:hypothetical protein